jgi:NAD(P)-dependent dehydrogenase (short-subunit alcohol dehydrogenase family)
VGQRLTSTALDTYGTVDVVVNNAGIVRHGYFEDLTAEQINQVLDVDLRSAFWVTQPAWRVMKAKGYGRVVLTGSGSGMFSHQGTANYAAAKAGLYGLMRALAFEGRDHGIGVNLLLPMAHTHMADDDPVPDYDRYRTGLVPAGGVSLLTAPEDNTPVLIYLVHRRCTLTGEVVDVCFGRYARLFVGVGHGWIPSERITAEEFGAHLEAVRDLDDFIVPASFYDELGTVGRRLGSGESGAS